MQEKTQSGGCLRTRPRLPNDRSVAVPAAARRNGVPPGKEANTFVPAKRLATSAVGKRGNPLRLRTAALRGRARMRPPKTNCPRLTFFPYFLLF